MAKPFEHVMVWGNEDARSFLQSLRLAEAFFEEMVDLPGFEPRPNVKGIALTGYNPKLVCPLTESVADFKQRLEGVIGADLARNSEDLKEAEQKEVSVKTIIYRGGELADKKTLEEQGVSPANVIHVIISLKKAGKRFFGLF